MKRNADLFVANYPEQWGEDEISAFFERVCRVERVKLAIDPAGRTRGFAFVWLATRHATLAALAQHGTPLDGHRIVVNRATPGKRD